MNRIERALWILFGSANEPAALASSHHVETDDPSTDMRFTISSAINGKVITISRYKRNPHGPDWTSQLYVVPEGADLMESVKTCITLGVLNK